MIHYTQIIWEEVAFSWKVTGKAVAISIAPTVHDMWLKNFSTISVYEFSQVSYYCRNSNENHN